MEIEVRRVDPQGRILLPSKWRKEVLGRENEVLIISLPDRLEVFPRSGNLEEFIDSVEVDVPEGKFLNYHDLRNALRRRYG
ncbi:AbrB family transcriptional regulator [Candidatus Geothermarchaeota archaeon]|nr:MAG: AbrB family transcriptional regulator [Candidatus Geothermarchaeota archaeon]